MKDPRPPQGAIDCGQPRTLTSCPYPGLRPFGCNEAQRFFGRARQIGDMLARLEDHRFMAVVGVSGCGKTSLVRAGLIPAIQDGYLSADMESWPIALMRPGNAPFARLTEALLAPDALGPERAGQPNAPAFLESTLRRGRLGLIEAVRESRPLAGTGLLLVVDQFEELFRYRMAHSGRVDADAFVDLLLASVNYAFPGRPDSAGPDIGANNPIMVILTMRSDFLGDCALFTGLPEAINDSQFLTPRLTRDQYRDAIREPARSVDGELTPELVSQLLNDMGDDPDQLPVLQHSLMRMWTRASARPDWDRTLGLDNYAAIGGLTVALSNHCDEVWGGLADDAQRHMTEVLFRVLSERGGDGRDTRHPETLRAVASVAVAESGDLVPIFESFRRPDRSFLTPPYPEPLGAGTMLDISHESLISH